MAFQVGADIRACTYYGAPSTLILTMEHCYDRTDGTHTIGCRIGEEGGRWGWVRVRVRGG